MLDDDVLDFVRDPKTTPLPASLMPDIPCAPLPVMAMDFVNHRFSLRLVCARCEAVMTDIATTDFGTGVDDLRARVEAEFHELVQYSCPEA